MELDLTIVNEDGTNLPALDKGKFDGVAFDNSIGTLIIKDADLTISGVKLNPLTGNYGIQAYILTLLAFNSDVRKSKLERLGWTDCNDPTNMNAFDPGAFRTRVAFTNQSARFQVSAPIFVSPFMQTRYLLPMTPVQLTLTLAPEEIVLLTPEPPATKRYKYQLKRANFLIEKCCALESFQLSVEKKLLSGANANFLLPHFVTRSYHVAAGSSVFSLNDAFLNLFSPGNYQFARLSVRPSAQPSLHPHVRPSVRPSVRPRSRPSIHMSVCPSVRPSFRPSGRRP